MATEERTARLTILIDPRKKAVFERLCAEADVTPSQVVRQLIRGYLSEHLGRPWTPEDVENPGTATSKSPPERAVNPTSLDHRRVPNVSREDP